jgi:hypothetical protein
LLQQTLVAGATWHVISHKWWSSWCAYTGFSPNAGRAVPGEARGERPGPIDNTPLLDPAYPPQMVVLRKEVQDGEDFALVESRAAKLLQQWYGGPGPEIARQVITVGVRKRTRVDLHPYRFRLLYCDRNGAELPAGVGAGASAAAAVVASDDSAIPPVAAAAVVVKSLPAKAQLSDVQEELHNAVVEAEEKKQREGSMEVSTRSRTHTACCFAFFASLIQDGLEAGAHQAS